MAGIYSIVYRTVSIYFVAYAGKEKGQALKRLASVDISKLPKSLVGCRQHLQQDAP
jgi:hypothetical protein